MLDFSVCIYVGRPMSPGEASFCEAAAVDIRVWPRAYQTYFSISQSQNSANNCVSEYIYTNKHNTVCV